MGSTQAANHELEAGDELIDVDEQTAITVQHVTQSGGVAVHVWRDERHGQEYTKQHWTHDQTVSALVNGVVETTDGKSHELVRSF